MIDNKEEYKTYLLNLNNIFQNLEKVKENKFLFSSSIENNSIDLTKFLSILGLEDE